MQTLISGSENANYIEGIIKSLDQNIVVIDLKGEVVIWTPKMEEDFISSEEARGKSLRSLFPCFWEEYRGEVWGDILTNEVIQKGKKSGWPCFPIKTKNRKTRYFDLEGTPLREKEEKIIGGILLMSDVTDKIPLERQLLRQARTTSLANLGASVAHEIRNPLNSISLNIQLVKEALEQPEDDSHEEMVETLENVLSEIERLNDIIRYFLQFSRPPAANLIPENPNRSVRQALRLLAEEARQAHVEIIDNLGKLSLEPIDVNQLSQAIYNICLNAIQAMSSQGGGKLEVATRIYKDYLLIEIKDNGSGIDSKLVNKLFDLFYTTKEEGSGLGLPIANQIVERHNGRIVAENNLDRGACFSIYLPITK